MKREGNELAYRVNKIRSRFVARNIYMKFIYLLLQSLKILQTIIKIVIVVVSWLDSVQVTILILFLLINIQ